ncbi:hypothetical protein A2U01_0004670, partial [Trifolium medium]|nr:hypothetical protein [Trifolium medium]
NTTPSPSEAKANSLLETLIWLQGKEELHIELETDLLMLNLIPIIGRRKTIKGEGIRVRLV